LIWLRIETGPCKHGYEPLGSIKCREFLNCLRTGWPLKKDSAVQGMFQKRPNFCYKDCSSFYSILRTVPFRVVLSTGDTPFPTFLPLLEYFLERTFYDGAQFSCRIFLNLLYGLETTSFQSCFKFRKQEKVCRG